MMKSTIRSFGIGLFLAGSIMTIHTHFFEENTPSSIKASKGSVVIKKEELDTLKEEAADAKEQLAKIQTDYQTLKKESSSTSKSKKKVSTYKLVIKKGMGSSEVSKALKDSGIIKDDGELERYIINKNKAKDIQIGDYQLSSDMSYQEIVKIITTGK